MPSQSHNESQAIVVLGLLLILCVIGILFEVGRSASRQTANVGMYAAVPATTENTIAQALTEKEKELEMREQQVLVKEEQLETRFVQVRDRTSLVYTTLIGLLLLALILLNFLLDARRRLPKKKQN